MEYSSLSKKAFIKYLKSFVKVVENKVRQKMPIKFLLMFDGWSYSGTYYVAMFALYPLNSELGHYYHLLCFLPLENEAGHSATEQEMLSDMLRVYLGNNFQILSPSFLAIVLQIAYLQETSTVFLLIAQVI